MSKELTINLSDVRKWLNCPAFNMLAAQTRIDAGRRNLTVLAGMDHGLATIFRGVPNAMLEVVGKDGMWKPVEGRDELWPCDTYRFRVSVTVVDDTAEDGEYEFASVSGGGAYYVSLRDETWAITTVPIVAEYICTEVEDANGQRGFVRVWQGPSTQEGFGSIEVVGSRLLCLDGPLTPKNVVFRKGN